MCAHSNDNRGAVGLRCRPEMLSERGTEFHSERLRVNAAIASLDYQLGSHRR